MGNIGIATGGGNAFGMSYIAVALLLVGVFLLGRYSDRILENFAWR